MSAARRPRRSDSGPGSLAAPSPDQGGRCVFRTSAINTDVIVLSTPEIAGLPYVIAGLVAAGGLAAALSTADGLLLAIANALSATTSTTRWSIRTRRRGRRLIVVARAAGGRGRSWLRATASTTAGGHPVDGRVGVLAWRRRACSRHWSWASGGSACNAAGRGRRHGRRLRLHLPRLPRGDPVLSRLRCHLPRDVLPRQSGDRRAGGGPRGGHGRLRAWTPGRQRAIRWPPRLAGSTSTTSRRRSSACRSASL